MRQIRKKIILDGKIKSINLYEFSVKWGVKNNCTVYFTECPEIGKVARVFKDNDFYTGYKIKVCEMRDGIIKLKSV